MDIDPLATIEDLEEDNALHREHGRLNAMVAVMVAVLATFLGICNVKDDNIVQGMQAAQTDKIDSGATNKHATSAKKSPMKTRRRPKRSVTSKK